MQIKNLIRKRNMKRFIAVALTATSLFAGADLRSEPTLSLQEAVALALKNNNTYKISIEKVRESRLAEVIKCKKCDQGCFGNLERHQPVECVQWAKDELAAYVSA